MKVLDFGLAKAMDSAAAMSPGLSQSPTIMTPAMTQMGMILGTAAYMSPEQAKGRPADKRSDVWAFGCVLYEMLTGRRAFFGEGIVDTLAFIITKDPDWSVLPANTPATIRTLLRRCLAKDRKRRVADSADVRLEIEEAVALPSDAETAPQPVPTPRRRMWADRSAGLVAGSLLTAMVVAAAAYVSRPSAPVVTRLSIAPPENAEFVTGGRTGASVSISPDGKRIAFTARDRAGRVLLWVRAMDSLTAAPLVGTDGAQFPFWSPDSRFIAYSAQNKLLKIPASGGPTQPLCAVDGMAGGAWSRDGVIVFSQGTSALFRVSSAGGQPMPLTRLAAGHTVHHFPSFLPDGRHVLFHVAASSNDLDGTYVASMDTGESKRVLGADSGAIYDRRSGHLLFVRQGTLLAQSFDLKTLTLADEPLPVAEQVESVVYSGVLAFSVSDDGVLAYGVGTGQASLQMVWVDRQGKVSGTVAPESNYRGVDLAPDGKRVVTHRHDPQGGDIWVTELSRGTTSRFTFDASLDNSSPIWSPKASQIVFGSLRAGKWGLYLKSANGAGAEERIVESNVSIAPMSWSPDGRFIVYWVNDPNTQYDLWLVPLSGDSKAVPLLQTPFNESHGQVSPDGKWLAYYSNETGQTEVHVQPFPAGAGRWQVSTSGGVFPRWRGDGRELFYLERPTNGKLMAVDVKSSGSTFEAGAPKELFDSGYINLAHVANYQTYAVSADGQHFLIPRASNVTEATAAPIAVVLNWAAALKK